MNRRTQLLLVATVAAVAAYFLWPRSNFLVDTIDRVVLNIVAASGISSNLARGVVILVSIPFFWAVAQYTKKRFGYGQLRPSLKLYTDKHGIIIVCYCAAYFLAMFGVSRDSYSQKWCADTREGIRVFDDPGTDPMYGIALVKCTPEQILVLRRSHIGVPRRIPLTTASTIEFFDAATGRPKVWFAKGPNGTFELFDSAGTHPQTQETLRAVDGAAAREILALAARDRSEKQAQAETQATQRETADSKRRADAAEQGAREDQRRAAAVEAEDKRKAAAADEEFVKTFVTDSNGLRGPAVLAIANRGDVDTHATQLLAEATGGSTGFFRPAFVSRGLFADVLAGDSGIPKRLGLTGSESLVVLAALSSQAASNQVAGETIIKVTTTAQVRMMRGARSTAFAVNGTATAFGEDDARRKATEVAVGQAVLRIKAF